MFEAALKGTKKRKRTRARKGRSTKGKFFGFHLKEGGLKTKVDKIVERQPLRRETLEEKQERAKRFRGEAELQEQKARVRMAQRAGRRGRQRGYRRPLSRTTGMRWI
jgi:hypothetical protein